MEKLNELKDAIIDGDDILAQELVEALRGEVVRHQAAGEEPSAV